MLGCQATVDRGGAAAQPCHRPWPGRAADGRGNEGAGKEGGEGIELVEAAGVAVNVRGRPPLEIKGLRTDSL